MEKGAFVFYLKAPSRQSPGYKEWNHESYRYSLFQVWHRKGNLPNTSQKRHRLKRLTRQVGIRSDISTRHYDLHDIWEILGLLLTSHRKETASLSSVLHYYYFSNLSIYYVWDGTATRYGLDGPGIESRWVQGFPHPSRQDLVPTQPPI